MCLNFPCASLLQERKSICCVQAACTCIAKKYKRERKKNPSKIKIKCKLHKDFLISISFQAILAMIRSSFDSAEADLIC